MCRMEMRVCYQCLPWVVAGIVFFASPLFAEPRDRFTDARLKMVQEAIVSEGIKNEAVLNAMRTVPRHLFAGPQNRAAAYFDQALAIGHKQTISPPFIVAYMTEMLDPQPDDKVLEIGTGSGYQAAVLSGLVKDVYTIEIVEPLGKNAAKLLKELGYENVHTKIGDGFQGWPEHAPFDKIIVTCSPENVPQPLTDQLCEGGRLIIPLGERYEQVFYLFEKKEGKLVRTRLLPTLFVPMTGISEQSRQVKPDPARPALNNGGFEIDEDADGHPDSWHYQRQLTLETSGAPEGRAYITFENRDFGRNAQALQGMACDGTKVASLAVSLHIKGESLRPGHGPLDRPGLTVQFFDAQRFPIETEVVGPWQGTFEWRQVSKLLAVPPKAREAILRIGLNGATGRLSVDEVKLAPVPR
ncbi:MAG: protein-L-isoaspartate(D-aspartate) O-methyltransferase [Planctomycetaceae bacterium]